jgi:hypothetical protein
MSDTPAASWVHRVWQGWRREIVRGAVLFALVVALGLFISGQIRAFEPLAMLRGLDFREDGDRSWEEAFRWAGIVPANAPVFIRNLNGGVTIERAAGESLVVVAERSARHSDPASVDVVAVPHGGGVTICALWTGRGAECGPDGRYEMKGGKGHNDVAVRFLVRLPDGVKLDVSTVNGGVTATGVAAPLALETVNGQVEVATARGPLTAHTVNGNIDATLSGAATTAAVELRTVNGSISAAVPAVFDADLEAQTVNGRVHSELPLRVVGRINPRQLRATIGRGGTPVKITTVNGSVTIEQAEPVAPPPPARTVPPVTAPPRTPRPTS